MPVVLLQADGLTDFHKAVRDQFQQGGSIGAFLLAILGVIGFVAVVALLTGLQKRAATSRPAQPDPQRLFYELLARLGLAPEQKKLLTGLAERARIRHPAILLLSRSLFERHAAEMLRDDAAASTGLSQALVTSTRDTLFGTDAPLPGQVRKTAKS